MDRINPPIIRIPSIHIGKKAFQKNVKAELAAGKPVKQAVMSWLSPTQQQSLDKHAPERLTLGNGKTPKVHYEAGAPPQPIRPGLDAHPALLQLGQGRLEMLRAAAANGHVAPGDGGGHGKGLSVGQRLEEAAAFRTQRKNGQERHGDHQQRKE